MADPFKADSRGGTTMRGMLSDDVRALIDGANPAHIATLMRDGSPHSVPVWIGREGDRVAFLTSPDSVKARNVSRDPRVSISVTDAAQPFSMAQVRGRVVDVLEGDEGWAGIDRISHKYIGAPYGRDERRALFLVEADRAWAWSPV
jgi:PPOX class probable F420-dependent enzyme